jgi:hypothetical protein
MVLTIFLSLFGNFVGRQHVTPPDLQTLRSFLDYLQYTVLISFHQKTKHKSQNGQQTILLVSSVQQ